MPGPTGKGCINFDSYVTATPPPAPAALPKQINGGDKKTGAPKPRFLGGGTISNHAFPDDFFE